MTARSTKRPRVALVTLGCPKNEVDSDVLAGELERHGITWVQDAADADAVLINTCGFIEAAKRESIDAILAAVELKKDDPRKKIAVWGCLSERYKGEIEKEIPEVDAYFGIEPFAELGGWLLGESYRISPTAHRDRLVSTPPHVAYLKIADGCDHRCTFCAIPGIKGPYRSRTPESILDEARSLVRRGVKELILIAQDTSRYGLDLPEPSTLPDLLHALAAIPELEWIRVMYVHPLHVDDALIDCLASEPKIVKYLDMPLQHIADPVLRRMGRGHDGQRVRDLIHKLRSRIPNVVLRTAFIVGFPGETEADFETLIDFITETEFDRLGAFVYSQEEGTAAAAFEPAVAPEVAQGRYDRLMGQQHEIIQIRNESHVGQVMPVIIDGYDPEEGMFFGRSPGDGLDIDQLVWVEGEPPIGRIVRVRIESSSAYDLVGVMAD